MGRPIIARAIETALNAGIFDEVMVSTEDKEIAEISLIHGAKVPFFRSEKNADDTAGTEDVMLEVLNRYEELNIQFDIVCCIYPTTPLMTIEKLVESKNKMLQGEYDTVFPVLRYGHPIQRALKINDDKLQMVWPQNEQARTQDLEVYFHDAGQYYWLDVKQFKLRKQILSSNTGFIELSLMEAQDIDNLDDWKLAELKFKSSREIE